MGLLETGVSLIGSLFKSKKHYNLYYWETADNTWKFVLEGHPDQIRAAQAGYTAQGLVTQVVRNKSGTAIAPTAPPAGYSAKSPATTNWMMIVAIVAGVGFVLLIFLKRRKKR